MSGWGGVFSPVPSLKREMRNLSEECSLEPVTVSMAYVYFEKLVLQGKLNKQNRKLCAGACVLLAAKISSDLRKHEVKHLIDVSAVSLVPAVVRTSSLAHRQRIQCKVFSGMCLHGRPALSASFVSLGLFLALFFF